MEDMWPMEISSLERPPPGWAETCMAVLMPFHSLLLREETLNGAVPFWGTFGRTWL